MLRRAPRLLLLGSVAVVALLVGGCSDDDTAATTSTSSATAATGGSGDTAQVTERRGGGDVVSEILAQFEPPEAPGFTMYLYRVEIPPGAQIPPHHHPGQQMARIRSGTLTYTVVEGTLQIGRDGSPTPTETVEGPTTVTLQPGDSVFEAETMIHEAANEGDEPVSILLSSLFTTGEELSIPVDD